MYERGRKGGERKSGKDQSVKGMLSSWLLLQATDGKILGSLTDHVEYASDGQGAAHFLPAPTSID